MTCPNGMRCRALRRGLCDGHAPVLHVLWRLILLHRIHCTPKATGGRHRIGGWVQCTMGFSRACGSVRLLIDNSERGGGEPRIIGGGQGLGKGRS